MQHFTFRIGNIFSNNSTNQLQELLKKKMLCFIRKNPAAALRVEIKKDKDEGGFAYLRIYFNLPFLRTRERDDER